MSVLVDSSVWIDYFRTGCHADVLEALIDANSIVTKDLILAELIPALQLKRQQRLVGLLRSVGKIVLTPDWDEIIRLQLLCLRQGINAVGIPDLLVAQHAMQNVFHLLTRDRHFLLLARHTSLRIQPLVQT